MANGFVEHEMPMPGDRDNRAGQLASLDPGVQRGQRRLDRQRASHVIERRGHRQDDRLFF